MHQLTAVNFASFLLQNGRLVIYRFSQGQKRSSRGDISQLLPKAESTSFIPLNKQTLARGQLKTKKWSADNFENTSTQ